MNIFAAVLGSLSASLVTLFLTPFLIRKHYALGIVGRDVHKPGNPVVPEVGGLAIVVGVTIGSILVALNVTTLRVHVLAFLLSFLFAAMIGLYDDLRGLKAKVKTALTVICCTPIIIGSLLAPHLITLGRPELPLVGPLRLTIIYWVLLPFAIAVPANAVNMMDVYNGVMPGTCFFATLALFLSGLLLGRWEAIYMSSPLLGALAAYYLYNKYPARIFSGDTGSLAVGASIGAIAVLSGLEVVGIVALMPHIMNAFHSLTSVKGLLERREIDQRPTIVLGDLLAANPDPRAPLTLANIILSKGPLPEKVLIKLYIALSVVACVLAVLTALLMTVNI